MTQKIPQFWDKGIQLVDGCTKVSPGCKNCWSEAMTARFQRVPEVIKCEPGGKRLFNGKVRFNLHLLEKAAKVKKPHVYAIWNDLYHEGVTDEQISDAFKIIYQNPHHTYLIITKRIEHAVEYLNCGKRIVYSHGKSVYIYPDNIWHIVTCENQAMADERIPHLLNIPGKRGIIIEPMLEAVRINDPHMMNGTASGSLWTKDIHQVILGPENGAGKRPFDPVWADSVKDQCEAAGVPFYRKDTGEGHLVWREASN